VEIRIYFEVNTTLRAGFKRFFASLEREARQAGARVDLIAAKDGPSDYRKAARSHPHAWNILLKDSEESMPESPVTLCQKLGILEAHVDDVFWMVELMESWFLADPQALADYYGQNFSANAIGATRDVEQISKADVERRLKSATRNTSKGKYHKVRHAPHLLERLDANRVQSRAAHCRQLFVAVTAKLESSGSP